jgi:choline/glycine/proline betaine transport protein
MFIARISRGRTIREFMVGVMFVPTTIAFFWLCMFGGNAIWQELNSVGGPGVAGGAGIIETVRAWNLPNALYGTIANLGTMSWAGDIGWIQWPLSALATFLLASWFITSSDSGTLVITTMLSMGDDDPPKMFRIIWGLGGPGSQ